MATKDFIFNTIKYAFPTAVSALVSILFIPIITRLYPTDTYGIISLFYSMGTLVAQTCMLGLGEACVRFFYDPLEEKGEDRTFDFAFVTGAINISILSLLSFLFLKEKICFFLFGRSDPDSLILFVLYVVATIAYRLQLNHARSSKKVLLYNIQQILYILINKVLFVSAVLYSTDHFYSILIITVGMILEVSVVGRRSYSFSLDLPGRNAIKQYIRFSLPLLPNSIIIILNNSIAKMVLSYYGDLSGLGIISMGTNLANVFGLFTSAFAVYWSSFMYENYQKEQKMIREIHNYCMLISIVLISSIMIFQDVLYLLLGSQYRVSQSYFMLIMLSPIQVLICETTSYGINISRRTYISMVISLITCAVNFGVCYFLYPFLGGLAMAIGIAMSAVFQIIFRTLFGQMYYVSIKSRWQTITSFIIIISIPILNTWVFDILNIRVIVALLALGMSGIIFGREIGNAFMIIINIIHSQKNI